MENNTKSVGHIPSCIDFTANTWVSVQSTDFFRLEVFIYFRPWHFNNLNLRYKSTWGGVSNVDFSDIVFSDYARDGGLFVPEYIPAVSRETLMFWSELSYPELCVEILSLFVNEEVKPALRSICRAAYSSSHFSSDPLIPIKRVNGIYILELFHGKTLAFKDFSLSLVALTMQYLLTKRNETANIMVHTHGDTGPAAAHSVE